MSDISVLLTSFRRPQNLARQVEAIRAQTVQPARLVVWHNGANNQPDMKVLEGLDYVFCKSNWGVWARFYFCLNFETEYVCVLDDDVVPGKLWLQNALSCFRRWNAGVVGCRGVTFLDGKRDQRAYTACGNPTDTPVDIIGHNWVFRPQQLLPAFCKIERKFQTCGEDYALAFAAQIEKLQAVVPHQPSDDHELWGNMDETLGADDVALWSTPGEEQKKAAYHKYLDGCGFEFLDIIAKTMVLS